jgi:nucleotide-binding universal stress UspA family protein
MNRILVGYDGSDDANTAVELVGTFASASDTPVLLVTVVPEMGQRRRERRLGPGRQVTVDVSR